MRLVQQRAFVAPLRQTHTDTDSHSQTQPKRQIVRFDGTITHLTSEREEDHSSFHFLHLIFLFYYKYLAIR